MICRPLLLTLAACVLSAGCNPSAKVATTGTTGSTAPKRDLAGLKKLETQDLKVGIGAPVKKGDTIIVSYTGKLKDGTQFDSNEGPDGKPYSFVPGAAQVVPGFEQGVIGMKAGGKRKISIPTSLAYAEVGSGQTVPPNADLYFTLTVLDVVRKGEESIFDHTDVKPGSGAPTKKGDKVTVNYVGTLADGKEFDNTYKQKMPFSFVIGSGEALPGLDSGITGMKVGGIRQLRLPPKIAFGMYPPAGSPVPPNTVVNFKVEMMKIQPGGK